MTQLFVVQSKYSPLNGIALPTYANSGTADYWVLVIAVCTFLILANHKHLSSWIQEHRIIVWSLPWGLSALWAALGLGIAGYGDIGACKQLFSHTNYTWALTVYRVLVHE